MLVDHDVHIHTNLSSCCHDPAMDAAAVIERARRLGLTTVGFANHMWDAAVPGASDCYAPQDVDHVLSSVRVLIGPPYCSCFTASVTSKNL
jgi:predicted metal-dependent phosphoesterase TrpH